jgi:hypothetical protein
MFSQMLVAVKTPQSPQSWTAMMHSTYWEQFCLFSSTIESSAKLPSIWFEWDNELMAHLSSSSLMLMYATNLALCIIIRMQSISNVLSIVLCYTVSEFIDHREGNFSCPCRQFENFAWQKPANWLLLAYLKMIFFTARSWKLNENRIRHTIMGCLVIDLYDCFFKLTACLLTTDIIDVVCNNHGDFSLLIFFFNCGTVMSLSTRVIDFGWWMTSIGLPHRLAIERFIM